MEEKTSVVLRDRQLVGANGGLTAFYQLRSYTLSIDLSHNDLFGPEGLKILLEGLVDLSSTSAGKAPESKLKSLKLTDCGLGLQDGDGAVVSHLDLPSFPSFFWKPLLTAASRSFHPDSSLLLLTTYLPHLPHLRTLDLTNNTLTHLPTRFITGLLDHPSLETLILSANPLGLPPPSSPSSTASSTTKTPAIHPLLTALLTSAPSTSPLRSLHLNLLSLSSLSAPLLLQLFSSPKRLLDLRLNANALAPLKDLTPLVDALRDQPTKRGNRFVQNLEIYGCFDEEDLFQSTEKSKELVEELIPLLSRNRKLLEGTREAGRELLRVGRRVLLGRSAAKGATKTGSIRRLDSVTVVGAGRAVVRGAAERRTDDDETRAQVHPFRLLDLPAELLQPIFSALYPGALSQAQVARLLAWVGDRKTLGKGLDANRVLKEVGVWWWEEGN